MDPDSSTRPSIHRSLGAAAQIIVEDRRWRRAVPGVETLAARAAAAAGGAGTVLLTSDRAVRRLNHRHRGQDKPTNVLTFESGDIVVALGAVRREARAERRRPRDHLLHLVVHGTLHLRGFDHHHPGEARRMEREEARLRQRLRAPNPWRPRP